MDNSVCYNVGLVSSWYAHETGQETLLLSQLRPGDLMEFQREGYQHWAVYVGRHAVESADGLFPVLPCLVHRVSPGDVPGRMSSNPVGSLQTAVEVRALQEVWATSLARVNNSLDRKVAPLPAHTVVQRAVGAAYGENGQAYSRYHLISNNCEHFACWARCGRVVSEQVGRRTGQLALMAVIATSSSLLPRPLALLAGLCVSGAGLLHNLHGVESGQEQLLESSQTDEIIDLTDD